MRRHRGCVLAPNLTAIGCSLLSGSDFTLHVAPTQFEAELQAPSAAGLVWDQRDGLRNPPETANQGSHGSGRFRPVLRMVWRRGLVDGPVLLVNFHFDDADQPMMCPPHSKKGTGVSSKSGGAIIVFALVAAACAALMSSMYASGSTDQRVLILLLNTPEATSAAGAVGEAQFPVSP